MYILNQIGSFIRDLTVEYESSVSNVFNEPDYQRINNLIPKKCIQLKHLRIIFTNFDFDMTVKPNTKLESITIHGDAVYSKALTASDNWIRSQITPSVGTLKAISLVNLCLSGAFLVSCNQLKSLELFRIKAFDYYNLLVFLKINRSVTTLRIDNSITKLKGFNFQHLAVNLRNLEKLTIDSSDTRMAGLPASIAMLAELNEIHITAEFEENDINQMIMALSTSIKSIKFAVSEENIIKISDQACGRLESFTNLLSLSIKGLKACDNHQFFKSLATISSLKNLSLGLRTDDYALYGLGPDSKLLRNIVAISSLIQLNVLKLRLYPRPATPIPIDTDKHISTDLNRMICLLAIQEAPLTKLLITLHRHSVTITADTKNMLHRFDKLQKYECRKIKVSVHELDDPL